MTQFVIGNFFATELTVGVTAAATTFNVSPSATLALPAIALVEDKEARLTLWDGVWPPEIVACTVNEQNGTLTVVRGMEGTTPQAWPAGTQVISALTAEVINAALEAFFDFNIVLAANFLPLAGGALSGALFLHDDPAQPMQAVTKQYADGVIGNNLPLAGGTMSGNINMDGNRILALPAPNTGGEPATKTYVDANHSTIMNMLSDQSGTLFSTGTSAAYVLSPVGNYPALTDGIVVNWRPHVTNVKGATLTFGGLATQPIHVTPGVVIPDGFLLFNQPVTLVYFTGSNSWVVREVRQDAFDALPGDIKHSGRSVDHGRWLLCDGRQVSRTGITADLFGQISNAFGNGNGSTTINIPDLRGRVAVGRDNMGGVSANRAVVQIAGNQIGQVGGVEQTTLTIANLPSVTPAGGVSVTATGTIAFPSNTINAAYIPAGTIAISNDPHVHGQVRYNSQTNILQGTGASVTGVWINDQVVNVGLNTPAITATLTGTPANATFNQNQLGANFTGTPAAGTFTGTPFGGGTNHTNLQPSLIVNAFVRF